MSDITHIDTWGGVVNRLQISDAEHGAGVLEINYTFKNGRPAFAISGESVVVPFETLEEAIATLKGEEKPADSVGHVHANVTAEEIRFADIAVKTESHWKAVRPVASSAATVTPEFVRSLLTEPHPALEPRFYAKTGAPRGVAFYTLRGLGAEEFVKLGDHIVLHEGRDPEVLKAGTLESRYEEVQA